MGHAKVRGKGWIEKDVGVLEGGARCPRFQTEMLQDAREMREYLRQNNNTKKHIQRKKGNSKIHKRGAKFNPKTCSYLS